MELNLVSNFDKDGSLIYDKGFFDSTNGDTILIAINRKGMENYKSGGIDGVDLV